MSRNTNFYFSFLALPPAKRTAIEAVWDFCRVVDDEVDEGPDRTAAERRQGLRRWRDEVAACFGGGTPGTAEGRAIAPLVERYRLPRAAFDQLIDGCEMDVDGARFATFCDLRRYCYHVASTVGLICIEVFGYENPATRRYAEELGIALQLTNILRDIPADLARGRLYLPLDELQAHGVTEEDLQAGRRTPAVQALLERQAHRAREQFVLAEGLLPGEDARRLVAARIMGAIYRHLLQRIIDRDVDVFSERVRLSAARKAWIALSVWARTMAWPQTVRALRHVK
jgi:15-cis-phytoene synthase